ncbi:TetR/AcrR family transcriptional regulator [Skermania piniformis]|uniref:TetR/AcrR family transcriptional regulator n=2 Tax=Skermania pinensis TaxID=39122 RepID=A0ABX8SCM8_9ACTN|nr:TetR/AcrR family transcriptional regulator [Skermania piniformis]QXQ15624.1 TetR/AcrR family transcriptional regulator [Skermania piniformis]
MTSAARREQILDVTHAIVDADGFHAATPKRIAADAGIHRSLIYQLFGDIPGLFVALIDRESARAAAQFADSVGERGSEADPTALLVDVFDGVLDAVGNHPETWRLFLFPPEGAPAELHQRLAGSQQVLQDFLTEELLRINPNVHDPEYTARILQATGRELLQLRLLEPEEATVERLRTFVRRLSTDLIFRPTS